MVAYLLTQKYFLQVSLLGVFSKKEDAEEQKSRIEKITNNKNVFCMSTIEILEVPFNSTKVIDEGIADFKKELGLD